ncbi:MAG: hypothetical protein H0Z19_05240 [Archaeoglobus sp.]|uniref:hypothetical protein n=1 Tax=Archaeoglobus sp. TaxID=1872626 RepID=UPI001D3EDFE6|nr:hypothetical protein [Archaeoglobus sp.]MBO8179872.1 hypothetical protein [Archaeoglobus sp.]
MMRVELPPFSFKVHPEFFGLFFAMCEELLRSYGGDGFGKEKKRVFGQEGEGQGEEGA